MRVRAHGGDGGGGARVHFRSASEREVKEKKRVFQTRSIPRADERTNDALTHTRAREQASERHTRIQRKRERERPLSRATTAFTFNSTR